MSDTESVDSQSELRSPCALCLAARPLQQSHVIPAFVIRHLKTTSATGYLRGPGSGHRVQDIPTEPLLCADCEQRFSQWERAFSLEAFPEIQGEGFEFFEYDHWLLKLAVSLSWRVLVTDRIDLMEACPEWRARIDLTLENWRRFLLGLNKNPQGVHHIFIVPGIPTEVPSEAHPKTLHYLMRAVDAAALGGTRNLAVYVKLLRSIFYAPMVPANPSGWHGTRIHAGPGRVISANQRLSMRDFREFLQSRVELGFAGPPSPKSVEQIVKAITKNPKRALTSETHWVHIATKHLWNLDRDQ